MHTRAAWDFGRTHEEGEVDPERKEGRTPDAREEVDRRHTSDRFDLVVGAVEVDAAAATPKRIHRHGFRH